MQRSRESRQPAEEGVRREAVRRGEFERIIWSDMFRSKFTVITIVSVWGENKYHSGVKEIRVRWIDSEE